jgi:signal transduction histidine kinase
MKKLILYSGAWVIVSLWATVNTAAQKNNSNFPVDISAISLSKEIRPYISTTYIEKHQDPVQVYSSLQFTEGTIHKGTVPDNYVTKKALVRFVVVNSSDTNASVYFFPGFYFTNIRLYKVQRGSLQSLPEIQPAIREKAGYRLLRVAVGESLTVVAELSFLKTYVNKIKPRLVKVEHLDAFITTLHNTNHQSVMVTFVFCGLLLMMVLYSISFLLQGGNPEFFYYSGYAFFIGTMLFTKALFNYHTEPANFFLEEYLDFVMQCLGIIFYMAFMQQFLNTRLRHKFLHRLYKTGILLLLFTILAFTILHFTTDNYPLENLVENGTKLLLLLMIIIFLIYSLGQWNDKLFRYLFWGNLAFLLFSLVSLGLIVAPGLFPVSGLAANSLIYYEAGLFFELVFFLAGLNYKNRRRLIQETREREKLKAQNMLKEYEKEIAVYKAQQEERQRISEDMHDELGSGMTVIRLMSEIAREKMKENTPAEIEKISKSADDVLNKMNAIIWSMNSSNDTLDNLISYIRSWSIEYFENTPVVCKVNTPTDIPGKEITGDKRRNIFLCVKETLNNVLKHSDATEVLLDISIDYRLVIRIADNGKGINMEKLRQFGNGLKNIGRRMESVGGSFTIENNRGVVIRLILPL